MASSLIELPSSAEYYEFVDECLRLADEVDAEERTTLLEIARVWRQIALDIDSYNERKTGAPVALRSIQERLRELKHG